MVHIKWAALWANRRLNYHNWDTEFLIFRFLRKTISNTLQSSTIRFSLKIFSESMGCDKSGAWYETKYLEPSWATCERRREENSFKAEKPNPGC